MGIAVISFCHEIPTNRMTNFGVFMSRCGTRNRKNTSKFPLRKRVYFILGYVIFRFECVSNIVSMIEIYREVTE